MRGKKKNRIPEISTNHAEPCEVRNGTICAGSDILIDHAFIQPREESFFRRSFDATLPVDAFFRQGRSA